MPLLGIATAMTRVPRDAAVLRLLAEIRPAFVLHRTDAAARGVEAAARLAGRLHAALRLESFGNGAPLANAIEAVGPESIAPYFPGSEVERAISNGKTELTAGTFADFAIINRNGVSSSAQRVTFALCPTVHARDDRSLVETLAALARVFREARNIAGPRKLDIGPCSLRRRLAPLTGKPAVRGPPGHEGAYDVDPRQHENLAGAWLACAIVVAAACGVDSFCTFEAQGARGLIRANGRQGRTRAVIPSPAHAVLTAFAEVTARSVVLHGVDPRHGAAFVVSGASSELWLVDLSGHQRVMPRYGDRAEIMRLVRGTNGARWVPMTTRSIDPYGLVRIKLGTRHGTAVVALTRAWLRQASRATDAKTGKAGRDHASTSNP